MYIHNVYNTFVHFPSLTPFLLSSSLPSPHLLSSSLPPFTSPSLSISFPLCSLPSSQNHSLCRSLLGTSISAASPYIIWCHRHVIPVLYCCTEKDTCSHTQSVDMYVHNYLLDVYELVYITPLVCCSVVIMTYYYMNYSWDMAEKVPGCSKVNTVIASWICAVTEAVLYCGVRLFHSWPSDNVNPHMQQLFIGWR